MTSIDKYAKLVEEAVKNIDGGFIEFSGMNCHETSYAEEYECRGWDGQSRRCDCGNRRVDWELNMDGKTVSAVAW